MARRAFDIICATHHIRHCNRDVEMGSRGKKKCARFAKRPQAPSREPMNGRSLGDRKKVRREKKIISATPLSSQPVGWAKSCSFARQAGRAQPGSSPASPLISSQDDPRTFRDDYRPSPATANGNDVGGGPSLSFTRSTVRNYKGESAFKDYEEDLSSTINKHNCPRSWRGRNSS